MGRRHVLAHGWGRRVIPPLPKKFKDGISTPHTVLATAHVWKQTNLLIIDLSNMISGSIVLRNQTLTANRFRVIAHRT